MSVFLGWMPDAAAQAALGGMRDDLASALPMGTPRHQWRLPSQWHCTLRYLGESLTPQLRGAVEAAVGPIASRHGAFEVALEQAQYWPGAKVLVALLACPGPLRQLHADLEHAMRGCGLPPEGRALRPHVTLAYLPTRDALPQPGPASHTATLRFDRVHLLQTVPGGYTSLQSWALANPVQNA